jgi:hypothetical protein
MDERFIIGDKAQQEMNRREQRRTKPTEGRKGIRDEQKETRSTKEVRGNL